ncbi:hypothetical protein ACJJIF_06880 [Microbulbifer sp. SSSA002]|uniref:hypothetical protein n=1 Tax=Microbulbifer sp. SSSA002 TaxID=3243376 RepID=UPI004039AF0E
MEFEIDKSKWSDSSQKSSGGHYDSRATHYENISYSCRTCSCSCVFSAQDQKEAYEIQKRFVWWIPSRCSKCQEKLDKLLDKERQYQALWNSDKEKVKKDKSLVVDWLKVIREIDAYGKKSNQTMVTCLVRCLNET